ncbi:MAG: hypothetical protein RLZZ621_583 [Gemmatimonadota bacterium]|jgi:F0F1-type ATP synthase assembly protein I
MAENPTPPPRDTKPDGEVSPWALVGLGAQFFAAIFIFVTAGNWLDRRFGTSPWFLLGGLFFGGGGAFYTSYRRLTTPRHSRDTDETQPTA